MLLVIQASWCKIISFRACRLLNRDICNAYGGLLASFVSFVVYNCSYCGISYRLISTRRSSTEHSTTVSCSYNKRLAICIRRRDLVPETKVLAFIVGTVWAACTNATEDKRQTDKQKSV